MLVIDQYLSSTTTSSKLSPLSLGVETADAAASVRERSGSGGRVGACNLLPVAATGSCDGPDTSRSTCWGLAPSH